MDTLAIATLTILAFAVLMALATLAVWYIAFRNTGDRDYLDFEVDFDYSDVSLKPPVEDGEEQDTAGGDRG